MLIAVFSDTHGNTAPMFRAVGECKPDMVLHLGDYCRDADALRMKFPGLDVRSVRGNCDYGRDEEEKLLVRAGGVNIFMTHGHIYRVKYTLDMLRTAAQLTGAQLTVFGHTHQAEYRGEYGIELLNPGSAGMPPRMSYAQVEIRDGAAFCKLVPLTDE